MTPATSENVPRTHVNPDEDPRVKLLTRREREVMTLIGQGLSTSHIADQLHLSMKTIKTHRWNLGKKLKITNRVELARIAIEVGLSPLTGTIRENTYELKTPHNEKIAYWSQILRGIHDIDAAISTASGKDFFPTLVKQLAFVLDAQCVFVGRVTAKKKTVLQTRAFWNRSKPGENFEFSYADTPCGKTLSDGICFRYADVRSEFIIPEPLVHLEADSYFGIAIHDGQGEPIGVLAAYFDKRIEGDAKPEIILQNFATRVGLELQSKPGQPTRQTVTGVNEHLLLESGNDVSNPLLQQSQDLNGANEVLRREVDKRIKAETGIQILVESSNLMNGDGYFQLLVTLLAQALQVKHAFISTLDGETNGIATVVAAKSESGLEPGFEYPLKGSPCESAISQTICYYPYGVRKLFPDDYALSTMDVESYFGIVLFSSDFQPLGILAVMDDKPLEDPKFAESIHRILASRAAAELDRLKFEALLKLQQDQAPDELDSTSDPLFIIDSYGVIRNISGPVQRIFGWEPSELIGKNISMLAPEPHRTQHDEYLAKYRKTGKTKIIGMTRTFNAERKNGELIPVELTVWPLDSQCQGELLFAGVMRDKSVRKAKTRGELLLPDRQSELKPV